MFRRKYGLFSDLSDKNKAFMEWKKKENEIRLKLRKESEMEKNKAKLTKDLLNTKSRKNENNYNVNLKDLTATGKSNKLTITKNQLNKPYYLLMEKSKLVKDTKPASILDRTREVINVERLYKIKNYLIEAGLKI